MNEQIGIAALYREEHQRWLREETPRRTLRDAISDNIFCGSGHRLRISEMDYLDSMVNV